MIDNRSIIKELHREENALLQKRAKIREAIEALEHLSSPGQIVNPTGHHKHHRISAAGRKRLSNMMKKRWAERRAKKNKRVHWTQKPENRARMQKVLRKMQRGKRKAKAKS